MLERDYQTTLIKKLNSMFPGCLVLKNDPGYLQGIPDLVIFHGECYAFLEVKVSERARIQPNQEYYIDKLNRMSFASFISPSTEAEVLDALRQSFLGVQEEQPPS